MAGVDCRDIFDAVYYNVKNIILSKDGVTKIKSKTLSESANEDGVRNTTTSGEPVSEARTESLESSASSTETPNLKKNFPLLLGRYAQILLHLTWHTERCMVMMSKASFLITLLICLMNSHFAKDLFMRALCLLVRWL